MALAANVGASASTALYGLPTLRASLALLNLATMSYGTPSMFSTVKSITSLSVFALAKGSVRKVSMRSEPESVTPAIAGRPYRSMFCSVFSIGRVRRSFAVQSSSSPLAAMHSAEIVA